MTRTALGLAAVALLLGCSDTAAPSAPTDLKPSLRATTTTTKEVQDTTSVMFEPCANENLAFHIIQQRVSHTTIDPNGTMHVHVMINDKGSGAVGTVSGRIWNQTGATANQSNVTIGATGNESFVESLNLIGRGSAPDLLVQQVFHVTVNRRGVVTVEFDRLRSTCRQ